MASRTTAGTLVDNSEVTGRFKLPIKELPSMTLLFVTITGTATMDLEVSDDNANFFTVATIDSNTLVQFAIPASVLAINLTAVSGSVLVTYRTNSLESLPSQALIIFDDDTSTVESPIEQHNTITIETDETIGAKKKLAQAQATTSPVAIYTVPADTQAIITSINVVNTDTVNPHVFTLWHDGSAGVNMIVPPVTLVLGGFAIFSGNYNMNPGDTLLIQGDANTVITITVTGVEESI